MRKALFVSYGGGHVAMVIPTVLELNRRGWQTTVMGLTTAAGKLRSAGIPFLGFRDLAEPGDTRAIEHGRRLMAENNTPGVGIEESEAIAYLGLSYADLEDRLGVDAAAADYAARKRHAFLPLEPLRRLLRREAPDVVIATCSPKAERAAIMAARELGIPSISLVDLFGREWEFLYDPNYATKTCVMSATVREDYLRRGRRPVDVLVTGNPAFDRLADPRFAELGRNWRHDHGLAGKRTILWADTVMFSEDHRVRVFREIQRCQNSHPDWHFMYRPHPSMGLPCCELPANCSLASAHVELAAHLHAADCVLVTISTCGIEAALLDKPVVKLRFIDPSSELFTPEYKRMDALAPYEEMGIVVPVTKLSELRTGIESVLPGGVERQRLRTARRQLPPVGQAARNVADAIQTLVDSSRFGSPRQQVA